jgi:hypothetical protein
LGERQTFFLHHWQDRRHGEAADSLGDGERGKTRQRNVQRRGYVLCSGQRMEELHKTQEYAAERERRRAQQPYEGDDRRKRANLGTNVAQPVDNPDSPELPVSGEDGTGRR